MGWTSLPWWIRIPVSLVVMGLGAVLFYTATKANTPRQGRAAMVIGMLIIGGGGWLFLKEPTDSEKKGYDF